MLGGMWNLRDHPIPWIFFTCCFDNEPADSHGSIFAKNFRQVNGELSVDTSVRNFSMCFGPQSVSRDIRM